MRDRLSPTGGIALAVAGLVLLLLVIDGLLGPGLPSFILTSLILALMTALLIRVIFKNSVKLSSWLPSERLETDSGRGLIARAAIAVEGAARGYHLSRREIASILRAALACRFGDRPYIEDADGEVARLIGSDGRMTEFLDPADSEHRRSRPNKRLSEEEEGYLTRLQEVISLIREGGR